MKALLGSALVATTLLAGCARDVGEQYVGKWVNVKSEKNVLSIEHNGESFIIRDTQPELFGKRGQDPQSSGAADQWRAADVQRRWHGQLRDR